MPNFDLPDPFLTATGDRLVSPGEWNAQREYWKEILAQNMYGHIPPECPVSSELISSESAFDGKAIREVIMLHVGLHQEVTIPLFIIRPQKGGKVPVITWNQPSKRTPCPIEKQLVCQYGYAIAEFDREAIAKDTPESLYCPLAKLYPDNDWGTIAMWAWGHMRVIDYLLTTDYADPKRLVATGHSRGGKVALCAAIYDERIAVCAPNGSGCGGGGCFRFFGSRLGENTGICEMAGSVQDFFPWWWCDSFSQYGCRSFGYTRSTCSDVDLMKVFTQYDPAYMGRQGNEHEMPFDMHIAKALIAPRAIITTDGLADTWANPFGTQLTWRAAQEVFDFIGASDHNALHFREGGHGFLEQDWSAIVRFCNHIFDQVPLTDDIVTYTPVQPAADPVAAAQQFIDWRNIRLHYAWRNPLT